MRIMIGICTNIGIIYNNKQINLNIKAEINVITKIFAKRLLRKNLIRQILIKTFYLKGINNIYVKYYGIMEMILQIYDLEEERQIIRQIFFIINKNAKIPKLLFSKLSIKKKAFY